MFQDGCGIYNEAGEGFSGVSKVLKRMELMEVGVQREQRNEVCSQTTGRDAEIGGGEEWMDDDEYDAEGAHIAARLRVDAMLDVAQWWVKLG